MFIGRQAELGTLERDYYGDGGFVVIYGRRRVGKTTLIKEFLKDKIGFYFLATEETESLSMRRMAACIGRVTGNRGLERAQFSDWLALFEQVVQYRPGEKKVLVLDELPYLLKTNPAFPSLLQHIWDEFLKDRHVMLILCGSQVGTMRKQPLSYDSPLYGRRTSQIRLAPLSFREIYVAQPQSFTSAVEQYAVTGGVPKYLEFFHGGESIYPQLQEVVLSKHGFLYEEPNFLLRDEVQSPVTYFSIIRAIAEGNHKLGKIASDLGMASSAITPYLATLIDMGFLVKDIPITELNPEKSRRGLYFISDNLVRFWFRYVYPYRGELELDNQELVLRELHKDFEQWFVALAYETICREIFAALCLSGDIAFKPSRIGSYWLNDLDRDTEIDVMAVDHQNRRLFAGECKYRVKPVDAPVYFALKKKVDESPELQKSFPGYEVVYGLFSKSGFTQRMLEMADGREELVLVQEDRRIVGGLAGETHSMAVG